MKSDFQSKRCHEADNIKNMKPPTIPKTTLFEKIQVTADQVPAQTNFLSIVGTISFCHSQIGSNGNSRHLTPDDLLCFTGYDAE